MTMTFNLKEKSKEEIHQLILDTSLAMASESNWDSVSMRKLSARLGVTTTVVYNQFKNKDELLQEIGKSGFNYLTKSCKKALKSKSSPKKQLKTIATIYWNFGYDNPRLYEVMHSMGQVTFTEETKSFQIKKLAKLIYPLIQSICKRSLDQIEVGDRFNAYWSYLHGITALSITRRIKGGIDRNENVLHYGLDAIIDAMKK